MTHTHRESFNRVITVTPGRRDLFVLTLINGRRARVEPIMHYHAAYKRALAFLSKYECEIKVLPVTGPSILAYVGIGPAEQAVPMTPAERRELVGVLKGVVRRNNDAAARTEALILLADLGKVAQ